MHGGLPGRTTARGVTQRVGAGTVALAAGLLLPLGGLTGCSSDSGAAKAVAAFARSWTAGTTSGTRYINSAGTAVPATEVATQMEQAYGDLKGTHPAVRPDGDPKVTGDNATEGLRLRWTLSPAVSWEYRSAVRLHRDQDGWQVIWEPALIHPDLHPGEHQILRRTMPDRAPIRDGSGAAIVTNRPVVTIQVHPKDVQGVPATARIISNALASVGVDFTAADITAQLTQAGPDAYVDLVTLRREAYMTIRPQIHELPGLAFTESTLPLAPTRDFGRAMLGTVAAVQKDRMDANPGRYAPGDLVGYGGIQEKYDQRLRGTPGFTVLAGSSDTPSQSTAGQDAGGGQNASGGQDASGGQNAGAGQDAGAAGQPRQLFHTDPVAGQPVTTTIDQRTQNAADAALRGQTHRSALVAIRVSDGAVLAVANGPNGGDQNLAFTAAVPPGSTFKMVTAAAVLSNGSVTPDTLVDCPRTLVVGGTTFHNAEDFALGRVPLHTDFAQSCNTAFASLAPKLGDGGLAREATALGIGGSWNPGLDAFTGKVSTGGSPAEQAAAAFGQGETQVSPLALAGAAAAVARGQWQAPRLVTDPAPGGPVAAPGPKLEPAVVASLKTMMREVVTGGTATRVRGVPGAPIYGKTGTAEYDSNPDHTHSWFIGFRGDIAFACFVENGGLSSDNAVPIVGRFFTGLG